MRPIKHSRVILLSETQVIGGVVPNHGDVITAIQAWVHRYFHRNVHIADDVLVMNFITCNGLSDEELRQVFDRCYTIYKYLDKTLLDFCSQVITDVDVKTYGVDTVILTIHAMGRSS